MISIKEQVSLKPYNTFGIEVFCKKFSSFGTEDELRELLSAPEIKEEKKMILGGGSNVLFTKNFDGAVLKNELKGIILAGEDQDHVFVRAGAGENWHNFVLSCIEKNYAGIENLSYIPGNTGAGPMQNIGAYGVELKDVFHELTAMEIASGEIITFSNQECDFGYRESYFKRKGRDRFVILSVTLKLNKKPKFNISYGAIPAELESMGIKDLSVKAVSDAVIRIRRKKLPDPSVTGNAGSFFKNPVIKQELFEKLKTLYSSIPSYPVEFGDVKIAAGWLIEQCGWKGKKIGNTGVHKDQALVLVNYGNASGKEVWDLSEMIVKSVQDKFGITLEREVNIL